MELPTFNARTLREGGSWRWAVLAPGEIAADFTRTLHENSSQRVVAVGSRSPDRAQAFALRFGIDRSYGSYDAAVADSAVDAVYVATPNRFHADVALLAIDAGKPVLVEKPFGVDAAETARVAHAGEQAGLKGRDGLVWQAVAMAEYLDEGRLQSPVWPMSESIALAQTLDDVETQLRAVSNLLPSDAAIHGR